MHPLLISQIAQDEIAERMRSVERQQMARQAWLASSRGHASSPGALSRLQWLVRGWVGHRPAWSTAFRAMDASTPEACPEGDRA